MSARELVASAPTIQGGYTGISDLCLPLLWVRSVLRSILTPTHPPTHTHTHVLALPSAEQLAFCAAFRRLALTSLMDSRPAFGRTHSSLRRGLYFEPFLSAFFCFPPPPLLNACCIRLSVETSMAWRCSLASDNLFRSCPTALSSTACTRTSSSSLAVFSRSSSSWIVLSLAWSIIMFCDTRKRKKVRWAGELEIHTVIQTTTYGIKDTCVCVFVCVCDCLFACVQRRRDLPCSLRTRVLPRAARSAP